MFAVAKLLDDLVLDCLALVNASEDEVMEWKGMAGTGVGRVVVGIVDVDVVVIGVVAATAAKGAAGSGC